MPTNTKPQAKQKGGGMTREQIERVARILTHCRDSAREHAEQFGSDPYFKGVAHAYELALSVLHEQSNGRHGEALPKPDPMPVRPVPSYFGPGAEEEIR